MMGFSNRHLSGHAIVEYVLPIALIIIGGGLVFWMTQAPDTILQLFGHTVNAENPAAPGTIQPYGTIAMPPEAGNLAMPAAGEESFCYVSGLCFNIPMMSGNNETSGSLGSETLHMMAAMLQNMGDQIRDEDPDLANLITLLALKAHEMGDQHALLEAYCGFGDTCFVDNSSYSNINGIINGMDPLKTDFNDILAQIQDHFANNGSPYPEAQALINYQAQGITNVVNGIGVGDGDGGANFSLNNPQQFIPQRANTICGAGGSSTCFRMNENGNWVPVSV